MITVNALAGVVVMLKLFSSNINESFFIYKLLWNELIHCDLYRAYVVHRSYEEVSMKSRLENRSKFNFVRGTMT